MSDIHLECSRKEFAFH